jgi:phosphatidylglycerophosphatase A
LNGGLESHILPPSGDPRVAPRQASLNVLTHLTATVFFAGYSVFAPGTVGSAVALVIYCLLPPLGVAAWVAGIAVLFFVGVYTASAGEAVWGKDPAYVVIDEFFGFFVTLCLLPQSVGLGIAGFFLFRFLDIVKPFPARRSENLPGGWGVMMDDLVVGVYGNLILRGVLMLLNRAA